MKKHESSKGNTHGSFNADITADFCEKKIRKKCIANKQGYSRILLTQQYRSTYIYNTYIQY